MFRHGDLLIVKVNELPAQAAQVQQREGQHGVVLAYGEATGHAHRIVSDAVMLWDAGEQRYLTVEREATLTHEEHGPITLPAGTYRVLRQRVYSPEEVRNVAD